MKGDANVEGDSSRAMRPEGLAESVPTSAGNEALVVDLDGTLVQTDLLLEGVFTLMSRSPLSGLRVLVSLWRGRAALKRAVAQRVPLETDLLPFNTNVLMFLREQKRKGREIVLATAADQLYADAVSTHLRLFNVVLASDGVRNLRGRAKAEAIQEYLSGRPYVYVGNDIADLASFERAAAAVLVNPSSSLERRVKARHVQAELVLKTSWHLGTLLRALRIHQWAKNVLVFLPAMAGHQILKFQVLAPLVAAFFALSLMASALYLLNDACDLRTDRRHPTKRQRPLANGKLSLQSAILVGTGLFLASLAVAALLPGLVWQLLICYAFGSVVYSVYLKRKHLMDVFTLASFYELRLLIGHESSGVKYSYWFLMFFGFMFLGLALLKRHNEALLVTEGKPDDVPGRPYSRSESSILSMIGISCGIAAVLILALYVHSDEVQLVYQNPYYLVAWCPIVLFLWLLSQKCDQLSSGSGSLAQQ